MMDAITQPREIWFKKKFEISKLLKPKIKTNLSGIKDCKLRLDVAKAAFEEFATLYNDQGTEGSESIQLLHYDNF